MTEELKTVLTIISVLVIGGICGHGLWSIRKNNKDQLRDIKDPSRNEPQLSGFESEKSAEHDTCAQANDELDSLGVGQPRVVGGSSKQTPLEPRQEPVIDAAIIAEKQSDVVEPNLEQPEIAQASDVEANQSVQADAEPKQSQEPSEVLIIHVSMPDNQSISGASLLPLLISMGFKFGEMDIFHRHQDSAGNGPVLFSLASMYNPGTFDIDNIEQISVRGLSMFMTLPCAGEALQNFNMMHNAAKKIAEQFGGQILDSHRSAMTVQTVRHYVEKIREFERQQLING